MSATCIAGLPTVSVSTKRVEPETASSTAPGTAGSTNVVVTPNRGNVWVRKLMVPPYSDREATMWAPASHRVVATRTSAA